MSAVTKSKQITKKARKRITQEQKQKFERDLQQLEQNFYREREIDEGKRQKASKGTYKKPNKKKRVSDIKAYEEALKEHRLSCFQFYDPFGSKKINLNIAEKDTIKQAEQAIEAIENQSPVSASLRRIGLKRLKIICKGVAKQHFESVIDYLKTRNIPLWMKNKYQELIRKDQ